MSRSRAGAVPALALGLALGGWLAGGTAAAQPAAPDGWDCQFCPLESGTSSSWSLGAAFVSDDSGKFGDYTGLDEKGFYAVADGELRHWGEGGGFWELTAEDLGFDSRSLALNGGRPGVYRLRIDYDEIPKYRFDDVVTPFAGVSGATLSLPAGWVPAGATAGLSGLDAALGRFDADRRRKRLGLGLAWLAGGAIEYRADYRREERSGTQLVAGSFAASSAWLPAPVDYVTDEVELGMSRTWTRGMIDIAYIGSNFSNGATALEWTNPFTPLAPGADRGRLALAPDSSAHRLSIAGRYRIGARTQLAATLVSGRLEQDDVFSAVTVNPDVAVAALPRTSLAGRVDTRRLNVDLASRISGNLRLTARYHADQRDNKTPRAAYEYVLTDLVPAGTRVNVPYGFERASTSLGADYRLPHGLGLKAGLERDVHDRSFQARERSEQDSVWAELAVRSLDWLQASVAVTDRRRDGSDYRPVDIGASPQNPLLRQYHLADRDQRIAQLDLTVVPHERVNLMLRAERSRDDYPESQLGLTRGTSRFLSVDASVELPGAVSAYAALGREDVEFDQAGSQAFAGPDWHATSEDTTNTRSLGLTKQLLDERMRLRLDYTGSRSRGVTRVLVGAPDEDFPDFRTSLHTLSAALDYAVSETLAVRFGYRKERYSSDDWQLDGVGPTTLASILSVGARSPEYNVDFLSVSFSYTPPRN